MKILKNGAQMSKQNFDSCVERGKHAYIEGHEMDFGVTVLSGLGGGHVDDLAGATWGAV